MPIKVRQLIEMLQELPPEFEIFVTDIDDQQEFSIFGIETGARQGTVDFEIQKREDDEDGE